MAVHSITQNEQYIGVSTDTKPTPLTYGAIFYETDTKKFYIWNESWVEM